MPRPMKVKIFMDAKPSIVEEQINAWLDCLGSATIIKTEIPHRGTRGEGPDEILTARRAPAKQAADDVRFTPKSGHSPL
jgi:hypothetical protein